MRVFDDMTDIVLDVPNAYHTLTKLMERGVKAGFVSASVAEQVPQRYNICVCVCVCGEGGGGEEVCHGKSPHN